MRNARKAWRRVRLARTSDPDDLRAILGAQAETTRLELVFADGTRCGIAKCMDAAALCSLIGATKVGRGARLELVIAEMAKASITPRPLAMAARVA